ncbi:MAG: M50 family metallopeptidase [Patescibacteria group bacterium]
MTLISYLIFFSWFFLLVFLSFLISKLWSRIFPGRKFRYFVAPGVIVHEFSHALACLLTGAKVTRISLFAPEGGFVEHGRSRFGFFGAALIAMAPIFGITLFLWLLAYWFGFSFDFQTIEFSSDILGNFKSLFFSAWDLVKSGAADWHFWIFVYLVISLSVSLAPSKQDFKNAFLGLLFLFAFGLAIFYWQGSNAFLTNLIGKYLGRVVSLAVVWEIIAIVLGLPLYLLGNIIFKKSII